MISILKGSLLIFLLLVICGCAMSSPAPSPTPRLSGVTLPNQSEMYAADQCIGAVVNGVCHGSVIGQPVGICHGTVLNGECIGVVLPGNSNPDRVTKPPTHDDMMRQGQAPTHQDMMCASNPVHCN